MARWLGPPHWPPVEMREPSKHDKGWKSIDRSDESRPWGRERKGSGALVAVLSFDPLGTPMLLSPGRCGLPVQVSSCKCLLTRNLHSRDVEAKKNLSYGRY